MTQSSHSPERITGIHDRTVRKLIDAHVKNLEDPLLLAVRYRINDLKDIFLLEVLESFPGGDDEAPLTTSFAKTPEFYVEGELHLTVASPAQLRAAMRRRDPLIEEIKRDGRVEYQSPVAVDLVKELGIRPGVPSSQAKARLELIEGFKPEERATAEEMEEVRRKWRQ